MNLNSGTFIQNGSIINIGVLNMNGGTIVTEAGASPTFPSISIRGPVITVNGSTESFITTTIPTNANGNIRLSGSNTSTSDITTFNVASTGAVGAVDLMVSRPTLRMAGPGGHTEPCKYHLHQDWCRHHGSLR